MTATQLNKGVDHFRLGLLFAIGSALSFGLSGPLAKSLMDAGWSPTGAVTARMAVGALAMVIFATIVRAWPGCTRSSRVLVQKNGVEYFTSFLSRWYGDQVWMYAHSSGLSGSPYSAIQLAPARSLL